MFQRPSVQCDDQQCYLRATRRKLFSQKSGIPACFGWNTNHTTAIFGVVLLLDAINTRPLPPGPYCAT